MQIRSQSAIEFLSTYSFAFLIIAVTLFLLLLLSQLPSSILPLQCSFYSGFKCLDEIYYNLSSGSQLVVLATDTEPGTMSITGFNALIDYRQSVGGYCTPNTIISGKALYCVANFSSAVSEGQTYTGTFSVSANYCANSPGGLLNFNCSGPNSYTYGGSLETEASPGKPPFIVTYTVSLMASAQSNVLNLDGAGYQYGQLPLSALYLPGTGHTLFYSPMVTTTGSSVYVFNSISGCGITTEAAFFVATQSCTVTATYNSISFGSCPQIPNSPGANLHNVVAAHCYLVGYDMAGDNIFGGTIYQSDLQNANLMGADLQSADLEGSNLQNANAIGANFQGADLKYVNMQNANAAGANFQSADLEFAYMQNANLAGANFQGADLSYANLNGANTNGANFKGAYTVGCKGCP